MMSLFVVIDGGGDEVFITVAVCLPAMAGLVGILGNTSGPKRRKVNYYKIAVYNNINKFLKCYI